jgi:hypothetical protein
MSSNIAFLKSYILGLFRTTIDFCFRGKHHSYSVTICIFRRISDTSITVIPDLAFKDLNNLEEM